VPHTQSDTRVHAKVLLRQAGVNERVLKPPVGLV
jgi:hypothetical protein